MSAHQSIAALRSPDVARIHEKVASSPDEGVVIVQKPRVDALEVIRDIRAGMDDEALRAKYGLTERGLYSLFQKLEEIGVLKRPNAKEVLQDIVSGMTNRELMEKHGLGIKGMEALYEQMASLGLLRAAGRQRGDPDVIQLNAREIVADVKAGMSRVQIMDKHKISWDTLQRVLDRLRLAKALADDVPSPAGARPGPGSEEKPEHPRITPRYYLDFEIRICEASTPRLQGRVIDIHEQGVGVKGLEAQVDDRKNLVILGDEFGAVAPFEFVAQCRWMRADSERDDFTGGFEIIDISQDNLHELRQLIQLATLGVSAHT
jgi:hypothetical protein